MNTNTPETPAKSSSNFLLWLSAAVLSIIVAAQLGLPQSAANAFGARGGSHAHGDVASTGDYTMLTLNASTDDILLVLDGRSETLKLYRVKNKNSLDALGALDLPSEFARGKRIGSGKK